MRSRTCQQNEESWLVINTVRSMQLRWRTDFRQMTDWTWPPRRKVPGTDGFCGLVGLEPSPDDEEFDLWQHLR